MLKRFLLHLVTNALGIYLLDAILGNFCFVADSALTTCPEGVAGNFLGYLIAGLLLGFLNTFVKPILKLLSLPITFLTAGLFMFVVNGIIIWLLKELLGILALDGSVLLVTGTLTYLYAAVILGLFNLTTHSLIKE